MEVIEIYPGRKESWKPFLCHFLFVAEMLPLLTLIGTGLTGVPGEPPQLDRSVPSSQVVCDSHARVDPEGEGQSVLKQSGFCFDTCFSPGLLLRIQGRIYDL